MGSEGWIAAARRRLAEARGERRSRRTREKPAMTTQSSPGQLADLQAEYGAEMAPPPAARDELDES